MSSQQMQGGQADESKEVMIESDRFHKKLEELNEAVSTLEDSLAPVLRVETDVTNSGKEPEARKSELGERLRSGNEKLDSQRDRLAWLIERLAV